MRRENRLNRRVTQLLRLEPRLLFDGAALVDAAATLPLEQALADTYESFLSDELIVPPVSDTSYAQDAGNDSLFNLYSENEQLSLATDLASEQIEDFILNASDEEIFTLFNGGKSEPDQAWLDRMAELRTAISEGTFEINIATTDTSVLGLSVAAFLADGPDNQPAILINTYWLDLFDAQDTSRILTEELGHAIDNYLNDGADTSGDEGELFAATVIDGDVESAERSRILASSDTGQIIVDGELYEAEFASYEFSSIYEVVTTTHEAEKEQNKNQFYRVPLVAS